MEMQGMVMGTSGVGANGWCNYSTTMNNGLTYGAHNGVCITFLFPEWVLNTQSKYAFAVIFTFLMGLCVEGISHLRVTRVNTMTYSYAKVVTYFFMLSTQVFLMYCLMLIAMTYSTYLFLAVIFGLVVGHMCFSDVFTVKPAKVKDEKDAFSGETASASASASVSTGPLPPQQEELCPC